MISFKDWSSRLYNLTLVIFVTLITIFNDPFRMKMAILNKIPEVCVNEIEKFSCPRMGEDFQNIFCCHNHVSFLDIIWLHCRWCHNSSNAIYISDFQVCCSNISDSIYLYQQGFHDEQHSFIRWLRIPNDLILIYIVLIIVLFMIDYCSRLRIKWSKGKCNEIKVWKLTQVQNTLVLTIIMKRRF